MAFRFFGRCVLAAFALFSSSHVFSRADPYTIPVYNDGNVRPLYSVANF